MKIGVSQCLLGCACTYSGGHHHLAELEDLTEKGLTIGVCPEVLGGLKIPRDPAEIISRNPLLIQTIRGQDVTNQYLQGAKKALEIFKENHVKIALLKFRSPSCGNDRVYDGTFSHTLIDGQGIFTQILEEQGIRVYNELQIEDFLQDIKNNFGGEHDESNFNTL